MDLKMKMITISFAAIISLFGIIKVEATPLPTGESGNLHETTMALIRDLNDRTQKVIDQLQNEVIPQDQIAKIREILRTQLEKSQNRLSVLDTTTFGKTLIDSLNKYEQFLEHAIEAAHNFNLGNHILNGNRKYNDN